MIFLFIGPSGSGKDTQADLLKDEGFEVLSTGKLLRDEINKGTELGEEIKKYYDSGAWAPDETVYKLVSQYIENGAGKNFILTGAIRRASQIKLLDEQLEKIGEQLDLVLNFILDEETAIERLSNRVIDPKTGKNYHNIYNPAPEGVEVESRSDDKPDAIKKRISEYNKYNDEIVGIYESRGLIQNIDASGTVGEINSKIKAIIKKVKEK